MMSMRRQRRGRNCLLLLLVLLFTTLNYRISIMKTTIRSTSPCWSSFIYTANAFGGIATSTINQNSYHNPYKKRHEQQLPNKSTLSLSYSLLTWNILAPIYAPIQKYPYCNPMHLDWINYRCPKIIKILQSSDSDIICLQEVQMDQINELFYNADYNLNFSSNYTIIVQNVTRDHQVGCAVLVKKEKFTVYAVESRSRALIVVLEPKQQCVDRNNDHDDSDSNNNTPLFLINCHLEAGVNMEEKRYYQIRSMLQRLQKHVNGYNKRPNNKASRSNNIDPYILIAGDMNSYINSNKICSIYNLFSTGKISRQLEQRISKHGRSQYKNASLPFLPLHDVYKHKYSFLSSIAKPREYKYGSRMNAIITMSLVGSAPQQQLQLKREQRVKNYNTIRNMFFANNKRNDGSVPSAESIFINDDNLKEDLLEMTFTGGSVLDYIWASDKFFVPRDNNDKQTDNEVSIQSTKNNFQTQSATSWPIHPWMLDETMIGCIRSTSPTSNRRKSRLWPSHVIPSDHIPIGIKFSLP